VSDNLTQEGGDRYADAAQVIAAIAEALKASPEGEIREAFGLGEWRVVTEAHRERYAEYFAPRAYWAMVRAMRRGMMDGAVLNIKGFARFSSAVATGELFPIAEGLPCVAGDMSRVDVTIAPGDDDCSGAAPSGVMLGDRAAWAAQVGGPINHYYGDWGATTIMPGWVHDMTPEGLELATVRGKISLVLDWGGLHVQKLVVVSGLLVWGRRVPGEVTQNGAVTRWDFEIVDGAPGIEGVFNASTVPAYGYGPHQQVTFIGEPVGQTAVCSAAWLARWIEARAEGVLSSSDVHALAWGDKTIPAAGWAACFPRSKWVVKKSYLNGIGQWVDRWVPVGWIRRPEWWRRFGGHAAEWAAAGVEVPEELVGDRAPPVRIYASFAPGFVADLNEVT
jgi:hypothetical protein